jgi:hypothetical protein
MKKKPYFTIIVDTSSMTLGDLYDRILSYPEDTMNFCIEDVFSWRGSYDEPCCSLSTRNVPKDHNLNMLSKLLTESFIGWKGGSYTYIMDDTIHFEAGDGSYSNEYYIKEFITNNHNTPEVKHIFG